MSKLKCSFRKVILVISFYVNGCVAVNFDLNYVDVISSANKNDYFGYSVLLQKGSPSNIIVGAPKSNLSFPNHVNLQEPGAAYKCTLGVPNSCRQFVIDPDGNSEYDGGNLRYNYKNKKDRGLLGAAIDGGDAVNDEIIICSPKWTNDRQDRNGQHYLVNGICYLIKNSQNLYEPGLKIIPLLDAANQGKLINNVLKYYYAMGQAGMSVLYLGEKHEILLGAPGVLSGMGTIVKIDNENLSSLAENQIRNTHVPSPDQIFGLQEESTYFGYSLSAGYFRGNQSMWYVTGAPRGKNFYGLVSLYEFLYSNYITVHKQFVGDQFGSYFGSSVLSVDFVGNNASDVLVGAPTYYEEAWDEGCVYFYKNDGEGNFNAPVKIFGNKYPGARFGTTMSSLGDINYDSYQDVAIAAPYEEGQGVVYIYLGNANGMNFEYSQKISARQIDKAIRGFGYSLSRGVDIDENLYKDIAIGAYKSGQVAIVKTRPIIQYVGEILPSLAELPLETKTFNFTYCLSYKIATDNVESVQTDIHISKDSRTLNNVNIVRSETLEKGKTFCDSVEIVLKTSIYDYAKPYTIEMIYTIASTLHTEFCALCPVTNPSDTHSLTFLIPFVNGCGKDNVCQPDLKVLASFEIIDHLIIGTMDSLKLHIRVQNNGEPAFLTQIHMDLPEDIEILRFSNTCELNEDRLYTCLIDNALQPGKFKLLTFELDIRNLNPKQAHLSLNLTADSKGEEANAIDNFLQINLPIKLESLIEITGKSYPDQIFYVEDENAAEVKSKPINFTHEFVIENNGPSPLLQVDLSFYVPMGLNDGKDLFKVYDAEVTVENQAIPCTSERQERVPGNEMIQTIVEQIEFPVEKILFLNYSTSRVHYMKIRCSSNVTISKNQYIFAKIPIASLIDDMDALLGNNDVLLLSSSAEIDVRDKKIRNYARTLLSGHATESQVSYWIYILCIIIALAILGLVVFVLYKLNFFHRPVREKLVNDYDEANEGPSVVRSLEEDDHDEKYN